MNILRNIFNLRTFNYVRQSGQNALINITQPVDNAAASSNDAATAATVNGNGNKRSGEPLIPKSILGSTILGGKKFGSDVGRSGSISPTTLKRYQSMVRKVELAYRCKLCNTRNIKQVTEAAYTSGVVILRCDGCSVDHLIIDHLGWFTNMKGKSFDEILAENSDRVKVIKINQDGDLI